MRHRPPAQPCKMRARSGGPGNGTGSGPAPRAGTTTLHSGLSWDLGADGLSRPGASPGRSEGSATYKGRFANRPSGDPAGDASRVPRCPQRGPPKRGRVASHVGAPRLAHVTALITGNDSRFQARRARCLCDRGRHALGAQRLGERPSIATGSRRSRASVRSSRSMFGRRSDRSLRRRARRGATVASYGCGRLRQVSSRGHWEGCEFPRGLPKRNGCPRRVDGGPTADRPRREARCPGQTRKY